MSLEAARALTLTDDHAQQVKVAKAANGQAHAIRRLLTTDKVATTSGAFLFVGQDAYAAKGGTITPDLFSQGDAGYADQPELVQELAEEKLDGIADEYRAIGWYEVRAQLDRPYDLYMKGSIYPATREPTDAEAERFAAIEAEIEAIAEAEGEDSARIEPLSKERDAINEGLRDFNQQQVVIGGVALWISQDGTLGKSFYRAKAEPKPKGTSTGPTPLYSNSLCADLSRIKTKIVQEAVAADPALALDLVLDSLAGQLLHGAHSYQMALEVQAKTITTTVADELMATSDVRPVEETMATRFASVPEEGRFEAIRAMATDDKMALLAGLVAMTVDGTVFAGGSPGKRHHHFEQIARATGVDIAARWSAPIALFDKMRRAAMIDLLREEVGAPSAENCASIKKKADLAVNVSGRLPANWLPAPMKIGAFDEPEGYDDADMDAEDTESMMDDEMADDEMA
ncbi:chromosome partitioning protein ParB [Sphingomonas sp. TF3]|uniref:chromosome partitioning protein ParB n=1 Tax=Sphingomonas sp. TF3 TaxID=2495580 RepID=UPI0021AF954E|nr:chromosome partitioning protein ParB [Sphingomonas sp. TF3]